MKKLISVLLAMLFVGFTFTACTSKTDDKTTAATTKEVGITSLEDLSGKKVAVQSATTSDDFAKALLAKGQINFQIQRYKKVTQCYSDMALGRVDAILVDQVVAAAYTDVSKIVWQNSVGEPMGICLKKGSDDLAAIVEKAIDTLYYDGTVSTIATKYFGSDVTKGVRTVTVKPVLDLTKLKTITNGTLMVGMEIGYPPMEMLDKDGVTYIGFDVELAQKLADLLGLKLQIVNTAWDGIFAALNKGEFDLIMSSVSITTARQAAYILTQPYISNKIVLAVPKN